MNELDTKTGFAMEWIEFGSDINAMFIVVAVAAVGLGVFFFTRKSIE